MHEILRLMHALKSAFLELACACDNIDVLKFKMRNRNAGLKRACLESLYTVMKFSSSFRYEI